jgi:hypothetical protein
MLNVPDWLLSGRRLTPGLAHGRIVGFASPRAQTTFISLSIEII